ncbi:hypothetical protein ACJX0J_007214 [Zea mays]
MVSKSPIVRFLCLVLMFMFLCLAMWRGISFTTLDIPTQVSDAAALDGISAISDSFTEFNIKANMKNSKMAQALSLSARSNDEKNNIDRLANGEDEEIDAEEIFTVNFALGIKLGT